MLRTPSDPDRLVLRGRILNPLSDSKCDYYEDGLIVAQYDGDTYRIQSLGPTEVIGADYDWDSEAIERESGLIMPPFYDTHFHWVQDDVRELPKASLLEWLERFTFPEEARFADPDYAIVKAKAFWKRILATGTVGGLCYSSIHATALDAAMQYAPNSFRIGGTLMTMNCPGFLRQTIEEAIEALCYGIETYGERYCVTPRFAPTTHPEVMAAGAKLAKKGNLFQQTHLDETKAEIEWVLGIYSEFDGFDTAETYTEIYHRCNMLGPRTVMGHAIHLEESELDLLARTDTAIASCPTSNAPVADLGLGSGLFNFEQAEERGIRWALASDIGGGPFLSMLDVMDSFVRQNREAGNDKATYRKALYRSTVAGAAMLGYQDKGNFKPGNAFDYIVLSDPSEGRFNGNAETALESFFDTIQSRHDFEERTLRTVVNGKNLFTRKEVQTR